MIGRDIRIAFRSIRKQRTFAVVNISGLVISLTAMILITLWVVDEQGYDQFHTKWDRIYRATWNARFGDNEWNIPLVPVPLAPTLEREFPEVEKTVQLVQGGYTVHHDGSYIRERKVLLTEPSFFDVFTVEVVSGNQETFLTSPDGVIITDAIARKYFGEVDPVGQSIELNDGRVLVVEGVVRPFPARSHMHFDFLVSLAQVPRIEQRKDQWGSATLYTYVLLKNGSSVDALRQKLDAYIQENVAGQTFTQKGNFTRFPLTPLYDIHLTSHLRYELEPNGDEYYVRLFTIIAGFILLLACVNFVNLATARSTQRAREVAMRKMLGSFRSRLIWQFLTESFVQVSMAMAGALLLAETALPLFNQLTGKSIDPAFPFTPWVLASLPAVVLVLTVLSGMYPAFVLSSFRPIDAMKGGSFAASSRSLLRQVLVILQFGISIALIIGSVVVQQQLAFLRNANLGFDKDQVLVIHRASALGNQHTIFRDKLAADPAVVDAAAVQSVPGQTFDSTVFELEQPANYETTSVTYINVDPHFVEAMNIRMVDGRNFSTDRRTDSTAFLMNRAAARAFGWDDPLGKQISMGSRYTGPVIGVVEDFHFESLHHEVKPMLLLFNRWRPSNIIVRARAGQIPKVLAAARTSWEEFVPGSPFEFSFLDEDVQGMYDAEARAGLLLTIFSSLSIGIAGLGLFGLAAFSTARRTKEIGVRKVLGASVTSILRLLSGEFLRLVLLANLIAWPSAYVAMSYWLSHFAYRTELEPAVFVLSAAAAALAALCTVAVQAFGAATMNPVRSLRYE